MSKRTQKDLWNELVDEAGEDAVEQAAGVSVAQAEAELRAAGVDVGAERARAEERLEAIARGGERLRHVRRPAYRRWVAAAGAVAMAAGAALVFSRGHEEPPMVAGPPPLSTEGGTLALDAMAAAALRHRAAAAYAQGRAGECLTLLDEARAKDPEGDLATPVVRLRRVALGALHRAPEP